MKAVIFDYGGVICFKPPASVRERMAALAGLPVETINKLESQYRAEHDLGELDGPAYYRMLLEKAGLTPGEDLVRAVAKTDQDGWKSLNPDTITLMNDVKKAGLKLGILSNMPWDFLPWLKANLPNYDSLDVTIYSCELNLVKPDPAIYAALIKSLGCDYKEVVFFDDIAENVKGALDTGINAAVFTGADDARRFLKGLGLEM